MNHHTRRYLETFELWNGSIITQLSNCESRAELKSCKDSIIREIKKENYPKVCERELITYVRNLK